MSKLSDFFKKLLGANVPTTNTDGTPITTPLASDVTAEEREVVKQLLHDFFDYMKKRHHSVLAIFLYDTIEKSIDAYLDSKIDTTNETSNPS